MGKLETVILLCVMCISFTITGFIGGLKYNSGGEDLQDANNWVCLIKSFETGDCVAYRWSDKRLENLDNRYRKHNPQQRPSVQQKQQDGARRIEIEQ